MKRALLALSAAAGLTLGFCTQPHEIRAAGSQPRIEMQLAVRTEQATPAAKLTDPSYPVRQRTCVGYHQTAR